MAENKYITIKDINDKVFTQQVRGYNKDEVDDFLDALASQMKALVIEGNNAVNEKNRLQGEIEELAAQKDAMEQEMRSEIDALRAQIAELQAGKSAPAVEAAAPVSMPEDASYYRNLETTLRETLLSAQRIADTTIAEAKRTAEAAVAEANAIAENTVSEARRQANDMLAAAETEAATLASNAKVEAEQVRAENEQVRQATADYRARIQALIREQMEVFRLDESLFE